MTTATPLRLWGVSVGIAMAISGSASLVSPPQTSEWSRAALPSVVSERSDMRVDTSTGQSEVFGGMTASHMDAGTSAAIVELRNLSGLTASQIARLFGVSRRSVNNWMSGKPMAAGHEERLSHLLAIIRSLPGNGASSRKIALLDSSSGLSLFHRILREVATPAALQVNPLRPSDQI